MSIPEIFARDGEAFFRARESEVLGRVLASGNSVISTGGGAWLRAENRAQVGQSGVSVWLDCDLETLWHRVRQRPTRPLLQTADPRGTLERLLAEREPVYTLADIRVPARRGDSIEQTTNRVIEIAVKGMLPKGPLGRAMYRKLKVYKGAEHPHAAQQPQVLDI